MTDAERDVAAAEERDGVSPTTTAGTEGGRAVNNIARDVVEQPATVVWCPPEAPPEGAALLGEADLFRQNGDVARALESYDRAREILAAALGETHAAIGSIYCEMGTLYSNAIPADFAGALAAYEKAVAILGPSITQKQVGRIHCQMGDLYLQSGDPKQAVVLYTKAAEELEAALGEENFEVGKLHLAMGQAYSHDPDNIFDVLKCYEKAMKSLVPGLGHTHPDVGRFYNRMGNVYFQCGKYNEAHICYERAMKILVPIVGHGSPEVELIFASIHAAAEMKGKANFKPSASQVGGFQSSSLNELHSQGVGV
jgi:tetratricopeptide (TPR) repeat protein